MFQSSVQRSSSHAVARVCSVPAPDPSVPVVWSITQALPSDDDDEEEERDMSNESGGRVGCLNFAQLSTFGGAFQTLFIGCFPTRSKGV